jgi:transposase
MIAALDLDSSDEAAKDALVLAQPELIASLSKQISELEARLGQPPKTPSNSSTPPSRGQKPNEEDVRKPIGKPHKSTAHALHTNPTRTVDVRAEQCPHFAVDVSAAA